MNRRVYYVDPQIYILMKKKSFKLFIISLLVELLIISNVHCQTDSIVVRLQREGVEREITETKITDYLSLYKNDGSFLDVDYDNNSGTAWPALEHLNRLYDICTAYHKSGNKYYHSTDIKNRIKKMFDFFYVKKPVSTNWWYEAIGVPIVIGPAMVMMKTNNEFGLANTDLINYSTAFLKYYSESIAKWPGASSGANKVWLLKGSVYKAVIESNDNNLLSGFQMAFSEVKIATGKADGIKQDLSFYQHGPQLYCAGYGLNFLSDICYFGSVAAGTNYQLSTTQLSLLSDLTIDGYTCFAQNSAFDFGSSGREISREGALSTAALITIIDRLKKMGAPRQAELTAAKNFLTGAAPYAQSGNRHFWKMDMMVQHENKFYFSVKGPSSRTVGTEWMNGENLKGKYLSWGATNIMRDGTEYRGIFPVWDWTLIPGVTSLKETLTKYPTSSGSNLTPLSAFSGGVTTGRVGLTSFEFTGFSDKNGTYNNLSAKKSYFFTPEAVFCFGTGVASSSASPAVTTLNQCFAKNNIYISDNKRVDLFADTEKTYQNLNWIFHNNVAYLFPTPQSVTVSNKQQTGTWYDINTSGSKTTKTYPVFSSYINHGAAPTNGTYNYIVAPFNSHTEISQWTNPFILIANDTKKQAVYYKNENLYGLVFYAADSVELESGLKVSSNDPCMVLIQYSQTSQNVKIYVADPLQNKDQIQLLLSVPLEGNGATLQPSKSSLVKFVLPSGENKGKTVSAEFSKIAVSGIKNNSAGKCEYKIINKSDCLEISFPHDLFANLSFFSLSGGLLFQKNLKGKNIKVPYSELGKNGIYIMSIKNKEISHTQKIMISQQ